MPTPAIDWHPESEPVGTPCPDCGVLPDSRHLAGCDVAQCPNCGGQLLSCGCSRAIYPIRPWDGRRPGAAECEEFGWYVKLEGGKLIGCSPDDPAARPDLNRLDAEARWDPITQRFVRRNRPRQA